MKTIASIACKFVDVSSAWLRISRPVRLHPFVQQRTARLLTAPCLFLLLLLSAVLAAPARADNPPPTPAYQMHSLAFGSLCSGYLPCTDISPFGFHLRAALALSIAEDRSVYAFLSELSASMTLFRWAEVGLTMPIELHGLSPLYHAPRFWGRATLIPPSRIHNLRATAFLDVHVPMGEANQPEDPQDPKPTLTRAQLGLVASYDIRKIARLLAAASLEATSGRVDVHGGVEIALLADGGWQLFAQAVFDQRLGCAPAMNLACTLNITLLAGLRITYDVAPVMAGFAYSHGGKYPAYTVLLHTGASYDENIAQRHGNGVEAAQAGWERLGKALGAWWSEWQAAAVYQPLNDELWWLQQSLQRHMCQGPACGQVVLPPLSPLIDPPANPPNDNEGWLPEPEVPDGLVPADPKAPRLGAGYGPGSSATAGPLSRGHHAHRPPHRWNPRKDPVPPLLPDNARTWEASLAPYNEAFQRWLKEQAKKELIQRATEPVIEPGTMDKAYANALGLLWFEAATMFLQVSSPQSAAMVEEMREHFRPLKYKPNEAAIGRSMEAAVSTLMQMGIGAAAAADLAALQRAAAHVVAVEGQATAAQMRTIGTLAFEAETGSGGVSENWLRNALNCIGRRCNPANYRFQLRGLGSNLANVEMEYVGAETAEVEGKAAPATLADHAAPTASSAGQTELPSAIQEALSRAKWVDDRLEATLDDGTKVLFRRDFGAKAHPIGSEYPDPVDHWNIEIQRPNAVRPERFETKHDLHIIVDEFGNPVDAFFKKRK